MSAERNERLSLLAVHNKTIILEQKAEAAHLRIDELKTDTAEAFKGIAAGIKDVGSDVEKVGTNLSKEIQDLRDWKNRALGWAAAAVFMASILGASIATGVIRMLAFPSSTQAAERIVGPLHK